MNTLGFIDFADGPFAKPIAGKSIPNAQVTILRYPRARFADKTPMASFPNAQYSLNILLASEIKSYIEPKYFKE